MEAVEHLIKNSIDKKKLQKLYENSLEQAKISLKNVRKIYKIIGLIIL